MIETLSRFGFDVRVVLQKSLAPVLAAARNLNTVRKLLEMMEGVGGA